MSGYISVHRKLMDSIVWSDPYYLKLWLYCLMQASYTEHDQLVGNNVVKLKRGQFITGRKVIAEDMNKGLKPSSRLSEKTWERYLKNLEKWQMLTIEVTNKYSVVTIDNYDFYQGGSVASDQVSDQQLTNKRPTNDQQLTTNNKDNKDNKVKKNKQKDQKDSSDLKSDSSLFDDWWNLYGNKKGRVKCEPKFYALLKKYDYAVIKSGTQRYLDELARLNARGGFVPGQKNPLTFLNGEHFNDEYNPVVMSSNINPTSTNIFDELRRELGDGHEASSQPNGID